MRKAVGISAVIGALAWSTAVIAAPGDKGNGIGGCIDSLYGNATNPRPGGNGVLPSQSPGPWVNTGFNEPPRNDRLDGTSVGEFNEFVRELAGSGANTQDFCREFGAFP